jgi:hypothetical protein
MGMGNYAQYADVVEESFVREVCPVEFHRLIECLDQDNFSMEELAKAISTQQNEEIPGKSRIAYVCLCGAFQAVTNLELSIAFHIAEDRGDEVDGVFWCVDGVYDYTPAGTKYKDKIQQKTWTVFG